jgi:hypothetical protein
VRTPGRAGERERGEEFEFGEGTGVGEWRSYRLLEEAGREAVKSCVPWNVVRKSRAVREREARRKWRWCLVG